MSHYTVMVIRRKGSAKSVDEMLAPYDENLEVAPYVSQTKAQLIAEKADEIAKERRSHEAAVAAGSEEAYLKAAKEAKGALYYNYDYAKKDLPEEIANVDLEDAEAVFALVKKEKEAYEEILNENGDLLSTYNPNSKWDYYDYGGRWGGQLKLKMDGKGDKAKAGEIDWDAMFSLPKKDAERAGRFWDAYVLRKFPEGVSEENADTYIHENFGFILYKPEYYLERYGTKEGYIRSLGLWNTYAVLDEKGWHAPGDMGWFGCSDETVDEARDWEENFRARFIDTLDPDDKIYIVDCHI